MGRLLNEPKMVGDGRYIYIRTHIVSDTSGSQQLTSTTMSTRHSKTLWETYHFIEKVYNEKRLHSALGHKSTDKFELKVALNTVS